MSRRHKVAPIPSERIFRAVVAGRLSPEEGARILCEQREPERRRRVVIAVALETVLMLVVGGVMYAVMWWLERSCP